MGKTTLTLTEHKVNIDRKKQRVIDLTNLYEKGGMAGTGKDSKKTDIASSYKG